MRDIREMMMRTTMMNNNNEVNTPDIRSTLKNRKKEEKKKEKKHCHYILQGKNILKLYMLLQIFETLHAVALKIQI